MTKYIFYLSIFLLFFTFCSCKRTGDVYVQLEQINNLLFDEKIDTALILLDELADKVEDNEDDYMFYQLLRTRLNYILYSPKFSDSIVNALVDFYERKGDSEKLAYSYYYKGLPAYERGDANKGMYWLKKAEDNALKANNHQILFMVYQALSITNNYSRLAEPAIIYGRKALKEAKILNDINSESDALDLLQSAFNVAGKKDSTAFYQQKILRIVEKLKDPQFLQPALVSIATYYDNMDSLERAQQLAERAYKIKTDASCIALLADIYHKKGIKKSVIELWIQSLNSDIPIMRMQSLRFIRSWYEEHGDTVAAWRTAKWMCELGDSLHQSQQTEAVARVQAKYDVAVTQRKAQQRIWFLAMFLTVCVFSFVVYWLRSHIKQTQAQAKIADNQRLIDIYKNELNKWQEEGKERDLHTKQLQQKLDALTHQQQEILSKGHQRYEEITQGGTVATWHKSDFLDFVEYYRMLNLPLVVEIESTHKTLSPSSITFLILQEMGYDDESIKRILCLSPAAFRTKRSRIKQKEIFS